MPVSLPQKGVITLDVKWENTQDKHFLLIVVHDTGIGVSLENKRNLFMISLKLILPPLAFMAGRV